MNKSREQRLEQAETLLRDVLADGEEHEVRGVQKMILRRLNVGKHWVTAIRRTLPISTHQAGPDQWTWKWIPQPTVTEREVMAKQEPPGLLERAVRLAKQETTGRLTIQRYENEWGVGLGLIAPIDGRYRTWHGRLYRGDTLAAALTVMLEAETTITTERTGATQT